jgi:DNA-binding response OmpR family regulator
MQGKRLLAVDDDPGILAIIRDVATELGFEVETLTKSTSFMTTYVRMKPDVITLDVVMPNMDGIELIRWLSDVRCQAGVIILSGGNAVYVEHGQKLATARGTLRTSVLAKPFRVADLRSALLAAAESAIPS